MLYGMFQYIVSRPTQEPIFAPLNGTFMNENKLEYVSRGSYNFPLNALCVRFFSREMKKITTGSESPKPEYGDFIEALSKKYYEILEMADSIDEGSESKITDIHLPNNSWSDYWNGKRMPRSIKKQSQIRLIDVADVISPGIVSKWFERRIDKNRLQTHLSALELTWVASELSVEKAVDEAVMILRMIHSEWEPGFRGEIKIPGPAGREGVNWSRHKLAGTKFGKRLKPDPKANISIGIEKGPQSELSSKASYEAKFKFQPENPISVVPYLLRYAIESKLQDPGLKKVFILDFLSAVSASVCIMQAISPGNIDTFGLPALIFRSCKDFFWSGEYGQNADFWFMDMPFSHFIDLIDEMGIKHNPTETIALIHELKSTYYDVLAGSGLTTDELIPCMEGLF